MGAAIGWFVGTVLAVLVSVFYWAPLLDGSAGFLASFFTGLGLSGLGLILGQAFDLG